MPVLHAPGRMALGLLSTRPLWASPVVWRSRFWSVFAAWPSPLARRPSFSGPMRSSSRCRRGLCTDVSSDSEPTRGGPQGLKIYTVTTLQIIEDLTGVDGETVEMWELGGRIGDEFFYVGGAVEYRLGEEVLVCLERGPQGLRSVAMGFSKFDVLPAVNGERRLRRNLRETVVVGGAVGTRAVSLRAAHADVERDGPAVTARPCTARRVRSSSRSNNRSRPRRVTWLAMDPGRFGDAGHLVHQHDGVHALADRRRRQRAADRIGRVDQSGVRVDRPAVRRHDTAVEPRRLPSRSSMGGAPGRTRRGDVRGSENEISGSTLAIGGGWGNGGTGRHRERRNVQRFRQRLRHFPERCRP